MTVHRGQPQADVRMAYTMKGEVFSRRSASITTDMSNTVLLLRLLKSTAKSGKLLILQAGVAGVSRLVSWQESLFWQRLPQGLTCGYERQERPCMLLG